MFNPESQSNISPQQKVDVETSPEEKKVKKIEDSAESLDQSGEKQSKGDEKIITPEQREIIESVAQDILYNGPKILEDVNLNFFKEIALVIINKGYSKVVVNNSDRFIDADSSKEIALAIIHKGKADLVFTNFDEFVGLELNKEIALAMIAERKTTLVYEQIDKFISLDHKDIALSIINAGKTGMIVSKSDQFVGLELNNEIALIMISSGGAKSVAYHLDKFIGLDREVALALIDADEAWNVASHSDKFIGFELNKEIALAIISVGQAGAVFQFSDKFAGLELNKEIALAMISNGGSNVVASYLDKFVGLDSEIALAMIDKIGANEIVEHLDKFMGLDKEVALALISVHKALNVASHIDKFVGFELNKETALTMISADQAEVVAAYSNKFIGFELNKETALTMISADQAPVVSRYINKFTDLDYLDYKEIALAMIRKGQAYLIFNFFNISTDFELNKEIASAMIEKGKHELVHEQIEKFISTDHKEIALAIINAGQAEAIVDNIDQFKILDYEEIALAIINAGKARVVVNNIDQFKILDHKEIALAIISLGQASVIDDNQSSFKGEWLEQCKIYHLLPSEYLVVEASLDEDSLADAEKIYNSLKKNLVNWQDEQNINIPFENAKKVFGASAMLEYLDRAKLSRHDGLHNFDKIMSLYEKSGLKPKQFFNNILKQVQMDDAEYVQGTAHHELNNLANNISLDFEEVIAEARQYSQIKKLQRLVDDLESPDKIFGSWKMLKKYSEINDLLKRKEILDELQGLKVEGKEDLYKYIETLAFHPHISLKKVMLFWRSPGKFLGIMDTHTPNKVQNRKKPSNYVDIPNLDLTAEELRDALVEGSYDKLQSFKAMEIIYTFCGSTIESADKSLAQLIWQAVGKRSKNIKGEAQNPNKLFSQLTKLFKRNNIKLIDYLQSSNPSEDFPEVELVKENAMELLQDKQIGLSGKAPKEKYRAKITRKSDPDGVVAGNDTACCMPFGSGKNNVYTFNPICSLFIIEKLNADNIWRTVAQSVITRNTDIGKNIKELVEKLSSSNAKMDELVDEDLLVDKQGIITCDNIEVAGNHKGSKEIIKDIYQDYFTEYLKQYAEQDDLDKDKVIIGMGYTDALTDLPKVKNTFIPEAPVGYSDNLGSESYQMSIDQDKASNKFKKKITIPTELEKNEDELVKLPTGVKPLDFHDSLRVAYIEGKAYKDNETLIEYLHNMENALIAKDVNNAAKDRPNLSIKYEDKQGMMHGYFLAYEGKVDKDGESVIFVSDLASDGNARAGGSLLLGFTELYKKHYAGTENLLPIYAQLRDKTSYKIINKQLDKLGKEIGIEFIMEEKQTYSQGDDTMHEVILRPNKIK
jgi:hypothetical protein